MTVQEFVDMAKFGELRNLRLGDEEDKALVSYINLGLIELYKRFAINTKELLITINNTTATQYTFPNEFMWLISAYIEAPEDENPYDEEYELSINNEDDKLSLRMLNWNTLDIPLGIDSPYVKVLYASAPDSAQKVVYDIDGLYLQTELALPTQLVEPLLFYIGYRAYGAMDGNINSESSTHYTRFDKSCKRIEKDGMYTNDSMHTTRVTDKGFI